MGRLRWYFGLRFQVWNGHCEFLDLLVRTPRCSNYNRLMNTGACYVECACSTPPAARAAIAVTRAVARGRSRRVEDLRSVSPFRGLPVIELLELLQWVSQTSRNASRRLGSKLQL
eukprot:COSAG02_NODE_18527_length_934_cov_0.876647_1_plen_114_part_10